MPFNVALNVRKTARKSRFLLNYMTTILKPPSEVRVVALLAAYNEERFVRDCIENLVGQGVEVYLIDNSSTDRTVEIARDYLGHGVIGIETFPRGEGVYRWRKILERKEELARTLNADWFMHVDADEIHLPPRPGQTIPEALARVQATGYSAVDFQEFAFVPTRENPDHDHPGYQRTMRWYYPFAPSPGPRLIRAWKKQREPVGISQRGGHRPDFPGMRVYPIKFQIKHYLFLSVQHVLDKYGNREFEKSEVDRGWHGWRMRLKSKRIVLPSQDELKTHDPGKRLDPSEPHVRHVTADWALPRRPMDLYFRPETRSTQTNQDGDTTDSKTPTAAMEEGK